MPWTFIGHSTGGLCSACAHHKCPEPCGRLLRDCRLRELTLVSLDSRGAITAACAVRGSLGRTCWRGSLPATGLRCLGCSPVQRPWRTCAAWRIAIAIRVGGRIRGRREHEVRIRVRVASPVESHRLRSLAVTSLHIAHVHLALCSFCTNEKLRRHHRLYVKCDACRVTRWQRSLLW